MGVTEWYGIRQGKQADSGMTKPCLNLTNSPGQNFGSIKLMIQVASPETEST